MTLRGFGPVPMSTSPGIGPDQRLLPQEVRRDLPLARRSREAGQEVDLVARARVLQPQPVKVGIDVGPASATRPM